MATGQTILNLMEALSPELQLQPGETDVIKGLAILNAAQDMLETLVAQHPQVFGSQPANIVTVAATETTTYPSGYLRIDGIDWLDPTTLLPGYSLDNRRQRGGHRVSNSYAWLVGSSYSSGRPSAYWTNGLLIYWDPIPDIVHTLRVYGFKSADDITASGTFAYPDAAMLPLASLAVRIIRAGLDDPTQDIQAMGKQTLDPYIDSISNFNRDGAHGLTYRYNHDT